MIPKKIHYCWFGRTQMPELALRCLDSWKQKCPDYEIIQWNEDNYDIHSAPLYVQQAFEAKQWAFVTDYVRLRIVYEHGGIYLDTDVEVKKSFDKLLKYSAFFGLENANIIATGLGFGSEAKSSILLDLMHDYDNVSFVGENGSFDLTPCPERNTPVFLRYGLNGKNQKQLLKQSILILPTVYMCPLNYETGVLKKSRKTISIHWYTASWQSEEMKRELEALREAEERNRQMQAKYQRLDTMHRIKHLPNRAMKKLLGEKRYEKLKSRLK